MLSNYTPTLVSIVEELKVSRPATTTLDSLTAQEVFEEVRSIAEMHGKKILVEKLHILDEDTFDIMVVEYEELTPGWEYSYRVFIHTRDYTLALILYFSHEMDGRTKTDQGIAYYYERNKANEVV